MLQQCTYIARIDEACALSKRIQTVRDCSSKYPTAQEPTALCRLMVSTCAAAMCLEQRRRKGGYLRRCRRRRRRRRCSMPPICPRAQRRKTAGVGVEEASGAAASGGSKASTPQPSAPAACRSSIAAGSHPHTHSTTSPPAPPLVVAGLLPKLPPSVPLSVSGCTLHSPPPRRHNPFFVGWPYGHTGRSYILRPVRQKWPINDLTHANDEPSLLLKDASSAANHIYL